MVIQEDKNRLKALLAETITLLCKNGLHYKSKFCIEALIGITLDDDDVFLVSIKETVKSLAEEMESALAAATSTQSSHVDDDGVNSGDKENENISKHKQSTPGHRRRSPKRFKSENSSHTPAKRSASEASASDMPSLSLDDMQGEGDEYWKSITTPGSGSESHDSYARTREDSLDEPPNKRHHHEADIESGAKVERTSSTGDVEDMPVLIKHEPDSDIEEIEDSFVPGNYSGVEGDMSMEGPSQRMLPIGGMQHGQMGPLSIQQGGANVWQQGAGGLPTAAAGAPGQHEEKHTPKGHRLSGPHKVTCPICKKKFTSTGHVKRHVRSVHSNVRFPCIHCYRTYSRLDKLKDHMRSVHQVTA